MASVVLRLSTGSSSSTVGTGGNHSLGGQMAVSGASSAAYQITTSDNVQNNLWDDMSKTDNFYENSDYRCIYVYVVSGSLSDPKIFINNLPKSKFSFKVASAKNTIAPITASETTEPVDPGAAGTWSAVNPTQSVPVDLLPSGQKLENGDFIYVWIKRQGNNVAGTGVIVDNMSLGISGLE